MSNDLKFGEEIVTIKFPEHLKPEPLAFFCTELHVKALCILSPDVPEDVIRKYVHAAIEAKQISVWNEPTRWNMIGDWSWRR